jgi:hypothetical protein
MSIFIPDIINVFADDIRKEKDDFADVTYEDCLKVLKDVDQNIGTPNQSGQVTGQNGGGGLTPDPNPCVLTGDWKFDPYKLDCCDKIFPDLKLLFVWAMLKRNVTRAVFDPIITNRDFKRTICESTTAIVDGMYGSAYDTFRKSKIHGLDRTVASIYLHYCSNKTDNILKALVFDEKVAKALYYGQTKSDFQIIWRRHWSYLTGSTMRKIENGKFSSVWKSSGYLQYLILMHSWASWLECDSAQIEIWLSKKSTNLKRCFERLKKPEEMRECIDLLDV